MYLQHYVRYLILGARCGGQQVPQWYFEKKNNRMTLHDVLMQKIKTILLTFKACIKYNVLLKSVLKHRKKFGCAVGVPKMVVFLLKCMWLLLPL